MFSHLGKGWTNNPLAVTIAAALASAVFFFPFPAHAQINEQLPSQTTPSRPIPLPHSAPVLGGALGHNVTGHQLDRFSLIDDTNPQDEATSTSDATPFLPPTDYLKSPAPQEFPAPLNHPAPLSPDRSSRRDRSFPSDDRGYVTEAAFFALPNDAPAPNSERAPGEVDEIAIQPAPPASLSSAPHTNQNEKIERVFRQIGNTFASLFSSELSNNATKGVAAPLGWRERTHLERTPPCPDHVANDYRNDVLSQSLSPTNTMAESSDLNLPLLAPQGRAAVNEIIKIRETLTINPLAGTLLESSPNGRERKPENDQEEFVEALRKVVAQTKNTEPLPLELEVNVETAPRQQTTEGYLNEHSPSPAHRAHPPHEAVIDPIIDTALAAALREACRRLDDKANDLEELGNYERADQLRDLSHHIRYESRRFDCVTNDNPRRYRR